MNTLISIDAIIRSRQKLFQCAAYEMAQFMCAHMFQVGIKYGNSLARSLERHPTSHDVNEFWNFKSLVFFFVKCVQQGAAQTFPKVLSGFLSND